MYNIKASKITIFFYYSVKIGNSILAS